MKPLKKISLLILLALSSCTPAFVSKEELSKYIADEDNGLSHKAEIHNYTIQVSYKPSDFCIAQELGDQPANHKELQTLRGKYDPYYYFILNLSKDNKEALRVNTDMEFGDLVQTLSFRMGQYVNLTTSTQDTIPTADFILDRTYGLSATTNLMFVFSKEKAKDKDWIQFNMNEFGLGIGNQRFRFKVADIDETPHIKFNTL